MKRQSQPYFSTAEIVKMSSRISNALDKIQKVANRLAEDGKTRDFIILTQATQSLIKVRDRLTVWAEASLKRDAEKTLKRAKEILEKTHPQNSNGWNIKNFKEFSQ